VLKDDVAVDSTWGDYVRARTREDATRAAEAAAPATNGAVV